jgi:hypothetical protein
MTFAAIAFLVRRHGATVTLSVAMLGWFAVAFLVWFLMYGWKPRRATESRIERAP